ncbi:type I-E CRISPR-associated protein Cse2/CasB [uncultured Desulfovibrio sp.]|uniref:type I-E CRISPR-associated protein Cse2/CasB n=1 Tax=uncultured Desulfovibrio sp. TaxID=167968 RepID=UPI00265CAAEF|nr:type I-E CRISPR-associated protein Cse2/CasB [uncultured Desulfovibrio sp.]
MSALMEFLLRNADNKRVMAILRCGLVESTEMRAWPLLAHLDGIGGSQRARAVRTVAGLFALHPRDCASGNMGTVCRQLCGSDEKPWAGGPGTDDSPGPMGRRFLYLLNADRDEICGRVCRLVRYAGSRDIPVNYTALEKDLSEWPRAREAWAAAFWAPVTDESAENGGDAS